MIFESGHMTILVIAILNMIYMSGIASRMMMIVVEQIAPGSA